MPLPDLVLGHTKSFENFFIWCRLTLVHIFLFGFFAREQGQGGVQIQIKYDTSDLGDASKITRTLVTLKVGEQVLLLPLIMSHH